VNEAPLILGYELTHFHYAIMRKRDAAANICSSPVAFILHNDYSAENENGLENVISQNESSVVTALFGTTKRTSATITYDKHASSSETANSSWATVSSDNHARNSDIPTIITAESINKAIIVLKHAYASWKTALYFIMVRAMKKTPFRNLWPRINSVID